MRLWGYIILVIGLVFLLLFILANYEEAHIGLLPFIIAGCLVLAGFQLIKSGKGILLQQPQGTIDNNPTNKMPMTQDIVAAIKQQNASNWKIIWYLGLSYIVFFILVGLLIAILNKKPNDLITLPLLFGALGVFTALMTIGAFWILNRWPMRRDIHENYYLRTKGPIKVIPFLGGAILQLADRAFLISGKNGMKELSNLNAGIVDYTPHGRTILAAGDEKGQSIYRITGYQVPFK